MVLLGLTLLPLIGSLVWLLRPQRAATAAIAGAVSATSLLLLLTLAPMVASGTPVGISIPWIPRIGLDVAFFVDGLGLFFAGIILGMGLLIIAYAAATSPPPRTRRASSAACSSSRARCSGSCSATT